VRIDYREERKKERDDYLRRERDVDVERISRSPSNDEHQRGHPGSLLFCRLFTELSSDNCGN